MSKLKFELITKDEIDQIKITFPNGGVEYCDPTDTEYMNDLIHEEKMNEKKYNDVIEDCSYIYDNGCTLGEFDQYYCDNYDG